MQTVRAREQWDSQCDFLLSCIGYSVGVGNIWRFPYLCYKHGGGAFLIPYVIMLLTLGIPAYVLELTLGQYASLGPNKLFQKLSPLFSGLGYAMLLMTTLVCFTYNMVIAWIVFYAAASFTSELAWSRCGHDYNTRDCFTTVSDDFCVESSDGAKIFWNNTCYPVSEFCTQHELSPYNNTHCSNSTAEQTVLAYIFSDVGHRALASEEYYVNNVLGVKNHSWQNFGSMKWDLSLCLLAAWILVGFCIRKGIKSFGRIIHFTVFFPYFILFMLVLPTTGLDGALEGLRFFAIPDYNRLSDITVWVDAASQTFFSLGCSHGALFTLASFNRFQNNCMRDAIVVGIVNAVTSILSGVIVFSMLGFMAKQMNKTLTEVVDTDLGLAFIVYPETLSHMPVAPLWSALFFIMMITLGLDSQFTMMESLTTAVFDEWPRLGGRKGIVVMITCAVFFVACLSMCFNGGVLVFALVDHYSVSYSLFVIALVEVLVVAWVFGAERLLNLMQNDMGIIIPTPLRLYWLVAWKYVMPLVLACALVLTLVLYEPASYRCGDDVQYFPALTQQVGLAMVVSPAFILVAVGVGVVCAQLWRGGQLATLLRPTADWGPSAPANRGVANEAFDGAGLGMTS